MEQMYQEQLETAENEFISKFLPDKIVMIIGFVITMY